MKARIAAVRDGVAAACAAAALALLGCVTDGFERREQAGLALAAAPLCCTTLAQARRAPLPLTATEVDIDASKAQAFEFGGNKAFFVLYELPPFASTYSVLVTSVAEGKPDSLALFVPRVALYDGEFKVVRFFDETSLKRRGNDFERTIFFNPVNAGERYLAIFGAEPGAPVTRDYSAVTTSTFSTGAPGGFVSMANGRDGRSTLHPSSGGRLRIEASGLAPGTTTR